MTSESLDYCRLCSSLKNLVSMFSGKSRTVRNSLRKMIHDTVNIQIERNDPITSVCFNCLVDISNFYLFKLHCIQNQDLLKNIEVSSHKEKKLKLSNEPIETLESPDFNSTENVLEWLASKRINVLESQDASKTFTDRELQVSQETVDAFTQYHLIQTESKESQTYNVTNDVKTTQTDYTSNTVSKKSQTYNINHVVKTTQTNYSGSTVSRKSQTNNVCNDVKTTQTDCSSNMVSKKSQTNNVTNVVKMTRTNDSSNTSSTWKGNHKKHGASKKKTANQYSQTEQKKLSCTLLVNSIVTDVITKDNSIQTDVPNVVDKNLQCDLLNNVCNYNTCKDALLNKCEHDFIHKNCQNDPPEMVSVNIQCDLINFMNGFKGKDLQDFYSKEVDSKLNIKLRLKEEKLSPLDVLTIPTSPQKGDSYSANSSDLLQIKSNKSHCVQICRICDKSLYNKREAMMHKKIHMQCHFCKKKFRSIKLTQAHLSDCMLKHVNISPFVDLVRVNEQPDIKEKYGTAFNNEL